MRTLRAFFLLPGSRRFGVLIAAFIVMVVAAAIELDTSYRSASAPDGLDWIESLYAALSLLTFSAPYELPDDPLSRAVFFAVPFLGLFVAGQLIVRLGGAVLNRERWVAAVASTYSDHVLVCGLGRVGFRVTRWLLDLGEHVVVIDQPGEDSLHDTVREWGVPIIVGDARRPEVLRTAGLERASAILPLTLDDLVNLQVATEARAIQPGVRVVLRTFDDRLAANLQTGFDIHRAYSTSALAAPAFATAALHTPVDYAFSFGEEGREALVTITKFTVVADSQLVGMTLGELETTFEVAVLAHRAERFEVHPERTQVLQSGDGFVVSATPEALNRLGQVTPPTRELRHYHEGRWPIER